MKRKSLLKLFSAIGLVVVVMALLISGCAKPAPAPVPAPAPEVIEWRLQSWAPAGDPSYDAAVRLAENVANMSNGRLVISPFPSGAILPGAKEWDGVIKGTVEVIHVPMEWAMHLRPATAAFSCIVGGLTAIQYLLWFESGAGEELVVRALEGLDVVYIGALVLHPPEIWAHTTVPLNSLDDIKGLKIRLGSAQHREIFTRMGAATVFMPGGEIYESAQRGVIDAFEYLTPSSNWPMGFHEVADYLYLSPTRSPHGYHDLVVYKGAWEKLSPDLKLIVKKATSGEAVRSFAETIGLDGEALQKFIDYGTIVQKLPVDIDEELIRVATEYYDEEAAADPFYREILDSQRAFKHLCELQDIR